MSNNAGKAAPRVNAKTTISKVEGKKYNFDG